MKSLFIEYLYVTPLHLWKYPAVCVRIIDECKVLKVDEKLKERGWGLLFKEEKAINLAVSVLGMIHASVYVLMYESPMSANVCLLRYVYKSMCVSVCVKSSSVTAELLLELFKARWVIYSINPGLICCTLSGWMWWSFVYVTINSLNSNMTTLLFNDLLTHTFRTGASAQQFCC